MSVVVGRFVLILTSTILVTCLPSAAQNSPKAQNSPNGLATQAQSQPPVASAQPAKHHVKKPHAAKPEPPAQPQPALPAGPLPPLALDQMPAVPPQVSYQTGELTIIAQNSTLGDILRAVKSRTGASFDVPPTATERVVGRFGPGPAREVLATLLNGSHFNYVMLGSAQDPNAMSELILTPKVGGDNAMNPGSAPGAVAQQQSPPQTPEQMSSDGADVENAADVGEENVDQNPPEQQNADQDGAPQGFPTDSNGQPAVKTPQQLLQELQQQQLRQQQLQQQMQQQQQQQPQGINPQQPVVYPNPQANPQRPQPQ